jgi:hypothetical protein
VTGVPPLLTGGVQVTVSDPTPDVATTFVGAPGAVAVLTPAEAADAEELPASLVATTLNV